MEVSEQRFVVVRVTVIFLLVAFGQLRELFYLCPAVRQSVRVIRILSWHIARHDDVQFPSALAGCVHAMNAVIDQQHLASIGFDGLFDHRRQQWDWGLSEVRTFRPEQERTAQAEHVDAQRLERIGHIEDRLHAVR